MSRTLNMIFTVKWAQFSTKDWVILGLLIMMILLILFFILITLLYKRKRFKFKINNIISDELLKIDKNNYKFSSRNSFILFNEIKLLILDKRHKYFYKFKKRYKDGNLNNELSELVKKYYLKNEKELIKKTKSTVENKKNDKNNIANKQDKQEKKVKWVYDDQNMTIKVEETK